MNEGDEVTVRRWFPSPASALTMIVREAIYAVLAVALVTLILVKGLLWFLVSTVSGPLGPSPDLIDALGPSPDLLDSLAARIESPEALIAWTMVLVVVTVVRLVWRAALKLALCTVLAFCGSYLLGYVLPVLRFFSQIP